MLKTQRALIGCLSAALATLAAQPGAGQYYNSPYSYYAQPYPRSYYDQGYYQDDYYDRRRYDRRGYDRRASPYDEDYAPRARPPARAQEWEDYGDPYRPPSPAARSRGEARVAALPPDADPAYSSALDLDEEVDFRQTTATLVADPFSRRSGAITIDTGGRKLYFSLGDGRAIEYGIGVGREGFAWKGEAEIGRKAYWPGWTPPKEMLLRRPDLPRHMEGGIDNPLGARALYLFRGAKDTMFRIHGTNEPDTIGQAVSSGCIRMLNADVIDLYRRVQKGARVVVL